MSQEINSFDVNTDREPSAEAPFDEEVVIEQDRISISLLPTRARLLLEPRLEQAEQLAQSLQQIVSLRKPISSLIGSKQVVIEKILNEKEVDGKKTTYQTGQVVRQNIEKVNEFIIALSTAKQGRDVSSFIQPTSETGPRNELSENEVMFGSIQDQPWLQRPAALFNKIKTQRKYTREEQNQLKEDYFLDQKSEIKKIACDLLDSTIGELSEDSFKLNLKELRDIRDQIKSSIQEGDKTKLDMLFGNYATKLRELKESVEKHAQIVEEYVSWFERNEENIALFYGEESWQSTKLIIEEIKNKFIDGSFFHKITDDNDVFFKSLIKQNQEIVLKPFFSLTSQIDLVWGPYQEVHKMLSMMDLSLESISSLGFGNTSQLTRAKEIVQRQLDGFKSTTEENEEFPQNKDVLWHTGSIQGMCQIIESGSLASRIEQLRRFGETSLKSGGIIKMTNDIIEFENQRLGNHKVTPEEYDRLYEEKKVAKHRLQEAYQVCFLKNGPYIYHDGVALLFPKSNMFSAGQYMEDDGIHIFDKNYTSYNQESPGFFYDLTQEPFVICVDSDVQGDFLSRLRQSLLAFFNEENLTEEKFNEFVEAHVVFRADSDDSSTINAQANDLFIKQGAQPIKTGFFVPTGEWGENQARQYNLLTSYKTTEELQAIQEVEADRRIPADKLIGLLHSSSVTETQIQQMMECLANDLQLEMLLSADAGVLEGYSIRVHTQMVLKQFEKYFQQSIEGDLTLSVFRLIILMHDIGKGLNPIKQHEYTLPIAERVFRELGYGQVSINFALNVINQDYIGNYLKGLKNVDDIVQQIEERAESIGITTQQYFESIKILYMADAGSYILDAGGKESLDHLFELDRDGGKMSFSNDLKKSNGISPRQKMQQLEEKLFQ